MYVHTYTYIRAKDEDDVFDCKKGPNGYILHLIS